MASATGMLSVLFPILTASFVAGWFVVARMCHKASLASLLTTATFPVAVGISGNSGWEVVGLSALSTLLVFRHRANIGRLLRREEHDLPDP